jgi:hypothetical protein
MTPLEESKARHPAGKGRAAKVALVYSTSTGEAPKGKPTDEATALPRSVTEPTTPRKPRLSAKRKPRVKAKPEPVVHVKVDPRVMQAARRVIRQGKYTRLSIIDAETVVVR